MTCAAAILVDALDHVPIYVNQGLPRDFWRLVTRDNQPSVYGPFGTTIDAAPYIMCGELAAIDFEWLLLLEATK